MAKSCAPCQARAARRAANFSINKYVVKDLQGKVVKEFGNKTSAAIELSKHPGYTIHPVAGS